MEEYNKIVYKIIGLEVIVETILEHLVDEDIIDKEKFDAIVIRKLIAVKKEIQEINDDMMLKAFLSMNTGAQA